VKSILDKKIVKVGYADITINLTPPNFKKDNMSDCYGQYLQKENKIEIQPELEKIDEANVLLHEVLHAIAYVSGETTDGGRLSESTNEEAVVNNFTNHLIQVFRDNHWLLSYFINNLLDKTNK
jgi:hypothetical protein|tara:strand:- start:342 stop:710 length:369 start_codon:yes stop_codon:yes gene_type:complete